MPSQIEKDQGILLEDSAVLAASKLISENPENQNKSLRIYLDGKGCDGFFYGVSFDAASKEDLHFGKNGIDLIVDPKTYQFVRGSSLEYVNDERGKGFIVNNPGHRKYRGKFYKRENWQERLG